MRQVVSGELRIASGKSSIFSCDRFSHAWASVAGLACVTPTVCSIDALCIVLLVATHGFYPSIVFPSLPFSALLFEVAKQPKCSNSFDNASIRSLDGMNSWVISLERASTVIRRE